MPAVSVCLRCNAGRPPSRLSMTTQKTHPNNRSFVTSDITSSAGLDRAFFSLACQVARHVVGCVLGILRELTCSRGYRPHQRVAVLVRTVVPHCHAVTHCVAILLAQLARLAVQVCVVVLVHVCGTEVSQDYATTHARRNKAGKSHAPLERAASQDRKRHRFDRSISCLAEGWAWA